MKPSTDSRASSDWVTAQLQGSHPGPLESDQRRGRFDRRQRIWWSIFYGSFKPRRRRPARRLDDSRFQFLDWHAAHLLAVAIAISLLSVADAFITVTLIAGGAIEVNPVMAAVIYKSAAFFAALKMGLTGIGVVAMVVLARYRFMRLVRVQTVLYGVLAAYVVLIGYEYWLLQRISEYPNG